MDSKKQLRYRRVVTLIHEDTWFRALSPGARNLFLNLIPMVGTSGAYNASITQLAKIAGYGNSMMPMWIARILVCKHLNEISKKVVYWKDDEVIWISNFTKHQGAGIKFVAGAVKHAQNFPSHIKSEIISHIDPSICNQTSKQENTKTNTLSAIKQDFSGVSDTLSDTPSDTKGEKKHRVSDTHAHVTELQSNRVTELQSNRVTNLINRDKIDYDYRFFELIESYHQACPTGEKINSQKVSKSMLKKIEQMLVTQNIEWWIKTFTKANDSDYISGRTAGGNGHTFKLRLSTFFNTDKANEIYGGKYDPFDKVEETKPWLRQDTGRLKLDRNPSEKWAEESTNA